MLYLQTGVNYNDLVIGIKTFPQLNVRKKRKFSESSKLKMSNSKYKYGSKMHFHNYAGLYFRKGTCERCGKLHKKNERKFDMHCKSDNYRILTQSNWKELCRSCHKITHIELLKEEMN